MVRIFAFICALAFTITACGSGWATGAIAFGSTGDVAKDGYSIGINANSSSDEEVRNGAMNWCRSHGPKETQDKCEILLVYHNQCVAEAQDPKPGTPGFGFATADTEDAAKAVAMAICGATAGKSRRKFFEIVTTICDK